MINVVGAGLAGSEAALQIAACGVPVNLYEMKPKYKSPAHKMDLFAELACSNSLRSNMINNAVGLLKYELLSLGSYLLEAALHNEVPAGGALAVDRNLFAEEVTAKIMSNPLITVHHELIDDIPANGIWLIATGPLTQGKLFASMADFFGEEHLHFFDAAAPIISKDSIDTSIAFPQSRYNKGGDDYLNCPMDENEYKQFYAALKTAERAEVHDFDREIVFEGCMPIETMASRGEDTMRFGPLKPVGLKDPRTGREPYACVQLRQDDIRGEMYNIVGFQTRLKQGEQRRVFGLIPGLSKAIFYRYGVMHRNTFINSPKHLNPTYATRKRHDLFFAGQMTGVEGYVESIASGMVAAINAVRYFYNLPELVFPKQTVIGAMANYISDPEVKHFQPMNANFGLLPKLEYNTGKKDRPYHLARRSLQLITTLSTELNQLRVEKRPVYEIPDPMTLAEERRKNENK